MGIELLGVTKRYGAVTALDSLTLRVPSGTVFGFLGPNGAGKTTAMRAVFGIVEPDAGEICWEGRPITRDDRRRFGYMPEERGLYPRMRVREQLVYLARLHGVDDATAGARADHWLEVLGVAGRGGDDLDKLSLGNQQRVQLAAALVHDPIALVLDEPFSGLDPIGVEAVASALAGVADAGATVLFSSHQLDLVQHHCSAVAIVAAGRLVATGSVDELTRGDGRTYDVELADAPPPLAGVTATLVDDRRWRLALDEGTDPQQVLRALVGATTVTHFALARVPLSQVFRTAVAAA